MESEENLLETTTFESLETYETIEKIMAFGPNISVARKIYLSVDKFLFTYYKVPDVILYYLINIPNIKKMKREMFYSTLGLSKPLEKLIHRFIDKFNEFTPYDWFYCHVLTIRDRHHIKYIKPLKFNQAIHKKAIKVGGRKLRLFTVHAKASIEDLYEHVKNRVYEIGCNLWYHGTSRSSADNMLKIGIDTNYTSADHGFGVRNGFCLDESFERAVQLAVMKNDPTVNDHGAVIVFKTPSLDRFSNILKEDFHEHWTLWDLSNDLGTWAHYTELSKNKDIKGLKRSYPKAYDGRSIDLIYGPRPSTVNDDMQLVLKSQDAHNIFGDVYIEAIIVFQK